MVYMKQFTEAEFKLIMLNNTIITSSTGTDPIQDPITEPEPDTGSGNNETSI